MAKYEEQFKIKVVQAYLQGTDGFKSVARRHDVPYSMVRRWVESFRVHGVAGLRRQSGSYSAAFKQSVLIKIRREGLSDTQAASSHLLSDRALRDGLEHFDERLDTWTSRKQASRDYWQDFIGPWEVLQTYGAEDHNVMRHYDPGTHCFRFQDKSIHVPTLGQAVNRSSSPTRQDPDLRNRADALLGPNPFF